MHHFPESQQNSPTFQVNGNPARLLYIDHILSLTAIQESETLFTCSLLAVMFLY